MAHSLTQFATDLTKIVVGTDLFQHHVMEKACEIVEKEAKRVIGTYDYNWTALAESTKADRVSKGFPEDEPLLRTGAMRDSIEHNVEVERAGFEVVGYVGTDNKIAVYQELGTNHIPPRSFLGEAAMHKEHEVHELFGVAMFSSVMLGLGMHVPVSSAISGVAKEVAAKSVARSVTDHLGNARAAEAIHREFSKDLFEEGKPHHIEGGSGRGADYSKIWPRGGKP